MTFRIMNIDAINELRMKNERWYMIKDLKKYDAKHMTNYSDGLDVDIDHQTLLKKHQSLFSKTNTEKRKRVESNIEKMIDSIINEVVDKEKKSQEAHDKNK